jgi:hypothetical protein
MHCKRIFWPTFETNTLTHGCSLSLIVSLSTVTLAKPLSRTKPLSAESFCSALPPRLKCYFQLRRRLKPLVPIFLSLRLRTFLGIPAISHRIRSFTSRNECELFTRTPPSSVRHNQQSNGFRYGDLYNAKINRQPNTSQRAAIEKFAVWSAALSSKL